MNNQPNEKLEEYKGKIGLLSLSVKIIIFQFSCLVFQLKFTEDQDESTAHSIYVKKYRSDKKSARKPIGKTLIALNIPPYADEKSIARVFSKIGEVENVILIENFTNEHKTKYQIASEFFNDKLPFKFLIGFIIFKKSSSVDNLINLKNFSLPPLSTKENPVLTGVDKWTAEHNSRFIDPEEMQKEIDEYMSHYDKVKRAENENQNNGDDDEDEEGWTTVGKKGNFAGFKQNEAVVHRLEQKIESQKKRAKDMLKKNFQRVSNTLYAFESREGKKQELIELRKKFQDDKAKLQAMRQNRKFKPY